jgi:putative methyltransferase (TIGR04325 family)
MKLNAKSFARNWLPPALAVFLSTMAGRRSRWTGNYSDWNSAVADSSGYDSDVVFESVRSAARDVSAGKALWDRDSVRFHHPEFNWPLLACLMTTATLCRGKLHVLDFGGAFGSTYMQHKAVLSHVAELSWNIVEQPRVVSCGKKEFATDTLNFFETMAQSFSARPINVILLSSVLQYVESPYSLLDECIRFAPQALVIDRTPFASREERITIQRVPKSIYAASYPCRFLDKKRVETTLTASGALMPWFASPVDPPEFQGVMSLRPLTQK